MKRNVRLLCIFFVCFLFISSNVTVHADQDEDIFIKLFRFFRFNQEFNQYLNINYNSSYINNSLNIEESLNVPIEFIYWTDVPLSITNFKVPLLTFIFRNRVVFGKGMPQQFLVLNITSKPDWLECDFTSGIIPVDIPEFNDTKYDTHWWSFNYDNLNIPYASLFEEENKSKITTSLIISPLIDAPSKQYSIGFTAYLQSWGMIKESIYHKNITFKPSFFPKIDIKIDNPLKIQNPKKAVNYVINVSNFANKKIQIIPKLMNKRNSEEIINPSSLTLYPNESSIFYFSKINKQDVGWNDDIEDYYIDFYVKVFPFLSNETYGPYSLKLTLNKYGMSTPGFTYPSLIFCLFIMIVFRKYGWWLQ